MERDGAKFERMWSLRTRRQHHDLANAKHLSLRYAHRSECTKNYQKREEEEEEEEETDAGTVIFKIEKMCWLSIETDVISSGAQSNYIFLSHCVQAT